MFKIVWIWLFYICLNEVLHGSGLILHSKADMVVNYLPVSCWVSYCKAENKWQSQYVLEWQLERKGVKEGGSQGGGGVFKMDLCSSTESESRPLSHSPLCSSRIMADVFSPGLLLVLMMSSLDWLSTPGSAFLFDQDRTKSGELLILTFD